MKTGLSIAIPAETYARIAPRSGLAVKHFIDTGAGVVDEDYRGEVGVVLFNHSDVDFQGEALWPLHEQCPCAACERHALQISCRCLCVIHLSCTLAAIPLSVVCTKRRHTSM